MCGRAAAVVDMSSSARQTIVVEVMPLVGGHLRLPKVRVSKYGNGAGGGSAILTGTAGQQGNSGKS